MEIVKVSIILLLLLGMGSGKEICPKMCICDVFEGYKRADCSDQNLASPYTNVAKSVEILNLSGNEITTIDSDCLSNYKDLVKLSFARNSIHTIELFAFESLEKLNYMDLSDNRLEVIDNRILERNEKLTFLDLSKNKFMLLEDKSLIISESLEFLSLRNSHLSHVYDSFFDDLPSLIDLDISNNLLITLMSSPFDVLQNLQFINLEYNRFSCDFRIENALQVFKQRKIRVKIDKCVKNSQKPMFEKMIMHPDMTTETPREDVEIELLWGESSSFNQSEFLDRNVTEAAATFRDYYAKIKTKSDEDDEESEFECDDDEMFSSTCECHQKFIKYYEAIEKQKLIQKHNMELRIAIIFWLGAILGVVVGCLIYFVLSLIRKKCENANQKQVERQKARDEIILTTVRTVDVPSPHNSPLPGVRNRLIVPASSQPEPAPSVPTRSPIPTPRNIENRTSDSPSVRRRTEPPTTRNRNISQIQSDRTRVELSPTAQLIHKLFRNRDPRLLPDPSEISPLTPSSSRRLAQVPELRIQEESIYTEIPSPTAPAPRDPDGDSDSEYLSIDNLSLILNVDNIRTDSVTPPPAYRSIFDDDK